MPLYYYINTVDNKVSTSVQINLCHTKGPLSVCTACSVPDQEGCKYRKKASQAKRCMYWREDMGGACDNVWAQKGVDPPKEE